MTSCPAPKTGDELVRRIATLDKSQEPFAALFEQVRQLLHIPQDALEAVPSLDDWKREFNSGFSPLDEWATKWLLRRMGQNEPDGTHPAMQSESWCLLSKLVARLPLKTVARLMTEFKLWAILEETASRLSELVRNADEHSRAIPASQPTGDTSEAATVSIQSPSRKRKRDSQDSVSSIAHGRDLSDSSKLSQCVIALLQNIQLRVRQRGKEEEGFARAQLHSSLQMQAEQAARALGNFFTTLRAISKPDHATPWNSDYERTLLLEAVVFLWDSRTSPTNDEEKLQETVRL